MLEPFSVCLCCCELQISYSIVHDLSVMFRGSLKVQVMMEEAESYTTSTSLFAHSVRVK